MSTVFFGHVRFLLLILKSRYLGSSFILLQVFIVQGPKCYTTVP